MKGNFKKMLRKRKKLILAAVAVVLAAAVGVGVFFYARQSGGETVYVYPFQYVGMTEYWGDSQESYGPVSSDNIQTVYLTETQTVVEILVQEGDEVKKGDLLLRFDTTLSDLQLERKRLEVEKLKLQLEEAEKRLRQINNMKPMVIPEYTEDEGPGDESLGRYLADPYEVSFNTYYDGSALERAMICWIRSDVAITDGILENLRQAASAYQALNAPEPEPDPDPGAGDTGEGGTDTSGDGTQTSTSDSADPVYSYYVVFKVTSGNMSLGSKTTWQGLRVTGSGSDFSFKFVDAVIHDHMISDGGSDAVEEGPQIEYNSGYTAAQIAQMRSEQKEKIKELEFNVKMAEAEYRIMQKEMGDGNVYAEVDGTVVSVLTEEEAKQNVMPIVKVSGGGGFYIEVFVNELEKDSLKIGQEVTVNNWNTGMTYTGTVDSIGDFPTAEGYWNGMGNPTASYYPFKVFVDGSADLQTGSYANVMYSSGETEHGIYLENPFLRTEGGKSYVLVLGADGTLEKRYVLTGKSLWGSYTEILSNLSAEDLVAFPYGKNVRPGVKAIEGDMSNLYG